MSETTPTTAGGTGLLERPDTLDPDGPVTLYLVDTSLVPHRVTLATTETRHVLDATVMFTILQGGLTCEIRVSDDGPALFTIPPERRKRLRRGEQVEIRLPARP